MQLQDDKMERIIKPIYEAIDSGSNKSAVVTCTKLLKKYPRSNLIKSLKALAFVRMQKVEDALGLCDEVLLSAKTSPVDEATLNAMMLVLRGLGRHKDMVLMYEEAYKRQPDNEELGAHTFSAYVRTGNWKQAQQLSNKLSKIFQDDRYVYWSAISATLQANDASTPPVMRPMLYKLAHRIITAAPQPSHQNPERFHLHLTILRELGLHDEAWALLETPKGKTICNTNLACDEVRRDIWRMRGLVKEEGERAEERVTEKNDRNWLEFLSILDATFLSVSGDVTSEEDKTACKETISKIQTLFEQIAETDGFRDRSGLLALLELERRARVHGLSSDSQRIVELMECYFESVGDKSCWFEDVKPYLTFESDNSTSWSEYLESRTVSYESVSDLQRVINIRKAQRFNLSPEGYNIEGETLRAASYVKEYSEGLKLGNKLAATELQPADDLIILAGHAYISLWRLSMDETHLHSAVSVLEHAIGKSKHAFQIRLLLIRLYRLLGAPSLALEHYHLMKVKQVQNDTLSHFVLTRASTFSLAASGDVTYPNECLESSIVYTSNSQDTAEYIIHAFVSERYSQIPEFIAFEERLDNSLQRDVVKIEHVRMRITHEPVHTTDLVDLELIELKFIFDRFHHDNRDFAIMPNYQPSSQPSLEQQTLLFDKSAGPGWLWLFLKLYIRAFQQASDLDDTVEEKLLIGDRPKQSHEPETQLPLKERLAVRKPEELEELTPEERTLLEFATALANWLEPYHNAARPSPAVVLAEAAKATELKTGHVLKGLELPPLANGSNGHVKKEEPSVVVEPPAVVVKYFDEIKGRFDIAVEEKRSAAELLHIAGLAQEAMLLFVIESQRFKPASVIKIHKLGVLVPAFKSIRTNALAVAKHIGFQLITIGEAEGTSENRKAFVESCKPLIDSSSLDHDFVLNVAKKVTDSRKKVVEGVGRGMTKLCTVHA